MRRAARAVDDGLGALAGAESPLEPALLVERVRLLHWEGDPALAAARRAYELARRRGAALAEAESALGISLFMAARPSALTHLRRGFELAAAARDVDLEIEAANLLAVGLQAFRKPRAALRVVSGVEARAKSARRRRDAARARWHAARLRMYAFGETREAIDVFRELLPSRLGLNDDQVRADLALALADVGDDAEAVAVLESAPLRSGWNRVMMLYARAEVELTAGRAARALAVADEACAVAPPDLRVEADVVRRWALVELGREPEPIGEWPPAPPLLAPARAEAAALHALAAGRNAEARKLFVAAADGWRGQSVRWKLRCLCGAGAAALRTDDVAGAHAHLEPALAQARRLGLVRLAARLERTLAQEKQVVHEHHLTAREREVLSLVGRGATSAEVAAALAIERSTVETHVRKAMAKLGARTRVHAAAVTTAAFSLDTANVPAFERRLLTLLADGATVTEAARLLHVSRRTATRRLAAARARMRATTTAELVAAAQGEDGDDGAAARAAPPNS